MLDSDPRPPKTRVVWNVRVAGTMDSEKSETLFGAGSLELSEFVSSWLLGYWAPSWRVRLGGRRLDSTMDEVDTDRSSPSCCRRSSVVVISGRSLDYNSSPYR